MKIKICLYGPTGSGKTTMSQQIVENYDAELFKIAKPIYELQDFFYKTIEKDFHGQDGEFLQFIGYKIEKERPGWLAQNFLQRIKSSNKMLIINDDCRLNSYFYLKEDGFIFINIYTKLEKIKERLRKDHHPIDPNHPVEQGFEKFQPDYMVDNNGSLQDSLNSIYNIIDSLIH